MQVCVHVLEVSAAPSNLAFTKNVLEAQDVDEVGHHRKHPPISIPPWQGCSTSASAKENDMWTIDRRVSDLVGYREFHTILTKAAQLAHSPAAASLITEADRCSVRLGGLREMRVFSGELKPR